MHPIATIPYDVRRKARHFYWAGYDPAQIADVLGLNDNTIRTWKSRDAWDLTAPLERIEQSIEARMQLLMWKEHLSGQDLKVLDALGRQLERTARVRRYDAPGGHEGDLNGKVANRNKGEKKKARKNHLTAEHVTALVAAYEQDLFEYQLDWDGDRVDLLGGTGLANVTRFILKSRQIGATFYFAREAFVRMLRTGNNQVFISASKNQANVFRQYIVDFVYRITGVELKGAPIELDIDGVEGPQGEKPKLYFLGTNYRTAQSYHGDVYLDEVFWVHGFEQINDVASAIATHARYRITYFSTPSTIAHEAYKLWNGERFNDGRSKPEQVKIDLSAETMRRGAIGPDGIFRQRVTLIDAAARGCQLINIERQRLRYPPDVFSNLYLCEFVDDSQSMFPFALMRRGAIDSFETWKDFDAFALRPYGDGEVWLGYDPQESASGDFAALAVIAAPTTPGGTFRLLEKHQIRGQFDEQAALILKQLERYNVTFIGIDSTGVGASVYQLVAERFPLAKRFDYSVPLKTAMVLKAKNVLSAGRFQYDAGARDVMASFMAIRAQLTQSQRQVTYVASRAGDTGHADLAWAIMHALYNEPLDPTSTAGTTTTRMRIFGHGASDGSGIGAGGPYGRAQAAPRARACGFTHRAGGAGDRREQRRRVGGRTHAARPCLRVRRSGAGAGPPGFPDQRAGAARRQLLRDARADAVARAHLPHVAASPVRDRLQA